MLWANPHTIMVIGQCPLQCLHKPIQIYIIFAVYTPEQCEKSIGFNYHANNGPTQQHNDNSSKEGGGAFNFMTLKEKA